MDKFLAWLMLFKQIPKRWYGIVIGFVCWLLILWVGFFPTLLLAVLMSVGYAVGHFIDDRADWQEIISRIWQSDHFDR